MVGKGKGFFIPYPEARKYLGKNAKARMMEGGWGES